MQRLETWANIQVLYIPGVVSIRAKVVLNSKVALTVQDFNLWLPSSLWWQVPCDVNLEEIEWRLRLGQAHDTLNELRQALRSCAYMLRFKDRFLRGQGANTRARNCLKSVDAKIDASAAKYRVAHSALLGRSPLLGKVGWMTSLRYLEKDDIRSMTDGTEDRASEGRRRLSWIWLSCGYNDGDTEKEGDKSLQDGMLSDVCMFQD